MHHQGVALAVLILLTTQHAVLPSFVFVTRPAAAPAVHRAFAVCGLQENVRVREAQPNVLTMPYGDLCDLVGERDARSAWNAYRIGLDPAAPPSNDWAQSLSHKFKVSKAGRETLSSMALTALVRTEQVSVTMDGTTKLLLELSDGLAVETVLIPPLPQQNTARVKTSLCVSSQVGCIRGCRFCATGAMGIVRSLSAAEILASVVLSRHQAAKRGLPSVDNIVFMGMGEPLDNPDAVSTAVQALTDADKFDFSAHKVLVSTVGPSPEALERLKGMDCHLAWSVHAADDATRCALVPSTRHSMVELRESMMQVLAARRQRGAQHSLMVEYVLLNRINDSPDHARRLAAFLLPLHAVTGRPNRKRTGLLVNLIPFNPGAPVRGFKFERPDRETVERFQAELRRCGVWASVRVQRGDDECAACGMLATTKRASVPVH